MSIAGCHRPSPDRFCPCNLGLLIPKQSTLGLKWVSVERSTNAKEAPHIACFQDCRSLASKWCLKLTRSIWYLKQADYDRVLERGKNNRSRRTPQSAPILSQVSPCLTWMVRWQVSKLRRDISWRVDWAINEWKFWQWGACMTIFTNWCQSHNREE